VSAPRLVFVALKTRDLEASTTFYRDVVGVPLETAHTEPPEQPDPWWLGGPHREYSWRDGAYLHLALFPLSAGEAPSSARIGFFADSLDAVHERAVAHGVPVLSRSRAEPWGRTSAYADPDGNVVTVTERRAGA
jgi:catechol 2,3-dioxygenase-like lactoylglutathione lyase family enzyme